ncbi:hypothetical protein [Anabaena lutea]|uniref:Uncharacterized protein n=1 Tax=Anabaena lutea FACHB-196 TaxID=2692881 RepID=A0ABR8FHI3_9NOST|nr:hypothetical protein [Anabaena lutea]MBD2569697.1 hypothetical protein [Anabaena lutea FACHB-196]
MAEPTLIQIFGAGASQDATTVTILKSDIGVTASAASGEAILAGMTLKAKDYLTQTNYDANIDQSIVIAEGFPGFANRGEDSIQYRNDEISITFSKVDSAATLDPNDY